MKTWFLRNWLEWRVGWSNYKNRKSRVDAVVEDTMDSQYSTLTNLIKLTKKVYTKFIWTQDSLFELFDRMRTPAECYLDYMEGPMLSDDCDGYHACLLHIIKRWGLEGALLTYMTSSLKDCHTILVVNANNSYYKVDYTSVNTFDTLEELVDQIKSKHPDFIDYNLVTFEDKYRIIKDF